MKNLEKEDLEKKLKKIDNKLAQNYSKKFNKIDDINPFFSQNFNLNLWTLLDHIEKNPKTVIFIN